MPIETYKTKLGPLSLEIAKPLAHIAVIFAGIAGAGILAVSDYNATKSALIERPTTPAQAHTLKP